MHPPPHLCLALLNRSRDLRHHLRTLPQIIDLSPARISQSSHILSLQRTLDDLDILDHRAADFELHLHAGLVDDVSQGETCVNSSTTNAHQNAGKCRRVCS